MGVRGLRICTDSPHESDLLITAGKMGLSVLTQPQPTSPSQSKKIFAGLGAGAIIGIILLVILGGIGGTVIYRTSQQPNIQATAINIGSPITDPRFGNVVNDGRVVNSASFDYTTSLPGTYSLVWDNSFSVFTSKSVSVTYTVSGSTHTQSFTVQPGHSEELSFNLGVQDRIYGNFAVSGGSNDVNFHITAQTCTQTVSFSFTLVNPGNANGFATARLTEDGHDAPWSNRYYVPQGGQVQGGGTITLPDCGSHIFNVVVSTQEKA